MSEQGKTYAEFIASELQREHDRRASLDARGLSIVTTSSALLALVFALSTLILGKDFKVTGVSVVAVTLSLLFFVVAAIFGIAANRLREYDVTHHDTLYDMLGKDHWGDTEVTARGICAFRHVITVQSLRPTNDRKADQITVALSFQVAAIAALSVAIGRELFRFI